MKLLANHFRAVVQLAEGRAVLCLVAQGIVYVFFLASVLATLPVISWFVCAFSSFRLQRRVAAGRPPYPLIREATPGSEHATMLFGRVAVITGSNTGIGLSTATQLCGFGCRVVMACRDVAKAKAALDGTVRRQHPGSIAEVVLLDLDDPGSVASFPERLTELLRQWTAVYTTPPTAASAASTSAPAIDFLVNNAGIFSAAKRYSAHRRSTAAGHMSRRHDNMVATNHLGTVQLTSLMVPFLQRSTYIHGARVIVVASVAHTWYPIANASAGSIAAIVEALNGAVEGDASARPAQPNAYGLTKLCNVLYARWLAKEFASKPATRHIAAVSVHPGAVLSDIYRDFGAVGESIMRALLPVVFKNNDEGAWTSVHCCTAPRRTATSALHAPSNSTHDAAGSTGLIVSGGYYADCQLADETCTPIARSMDAAEAVMKWTFTQLATATSSSS